MNHTEIETLNAYLDGELDDAAKRTVTAHLSGCEACKANLNSITDVRTALGGLPEPNLTAEDSAALRRRIMTEAIQPRRRFPNFRLSTAFAAATLLVVAGLGVSLLRGTGSEQGSSIGLTDRSVPLEDSTSEHRFASELDVRSFAENDPELLAAAGQFTVQDLVPEPESAALAGPPQERVGESAADSVQPKTATQCADEIGRKASSPSKLVLQRLAVFQGQEAYLLVFAYAVSSEPDAPLDRLRVWLISRTDCDNVLYGYSFKP